MSCGTGTTIRIIHSFLRCWKQSPGEDLARTLDNSEKKPGPHFIVAHGFKQPNYLRSLLPSTECVGNLIGIKTCHVLERHQSL